MNPRVAARTVTSPSKIFYTYILFDWLGIPRLVGKGKGNRVASHWKCFDPTSWRKNEFVEITWIMLGEIPYIKVVENVTEKEAFAAEIALISAIGREDQGKGPLLNRTDGGEGVSGYACDLQIRLARRERMIRFLESLTPEQHSAIGRKGGIAAMAQRSLEEKQATGRHAGNTFVNSLTPEEMRLRMLEIKSNITPDGLIRSRDALLRVLSNTTKEQLVEYGKKGYINSLLLLSPEEKSEIGRRGGKVGGPARAASLTPERRKEIGDLGGAAAAAASPEERSRRSFKAAASQTPEQRRDKAVRMWITRRAKAAQKENSPLEPARE